MNLMHLTVLEMGGGVRLLKWYTFVHPTPEFYLVGGFVGASLSSKLQSNCILGQFLEIRQNEQTGTFKLQLHMDGKT